MKIRISPKKIILALVILGTVRLVQYAISDMNLDIDLLRESLLNMPGMVMENIRFSREISGDLWQVKLPYVEEKNKLLIFMSADISRTLSGDKGRWSFFGRTGTYSDDAKTASITGLTGTLQENNRTWVLESPKFTWQDKNTTFTFPEGLTIRDEEFSLVTPVASTDNSRVILLQHGGVIRWRKAKSLTR